MKIVKRKDQDSGLICEDRNYFDAIKNEKQLKLSSEELEEIDLNKLIRMLK